MPPKFWKGVSLAPGQGKTGLIALVVNWSFLHAVGVNSICIITVNADLVKKLQNDLGPVMITDKHYEVCIPKGAISKADV